MQVERRIPRKVLVRLGTGLLIAILAFIIYGMFFSYHEVPATISGFSWSRNVEVQEYQLLAQEGWSQPADATPTGHETRQSGTRKVSDGYHTETYLDTCYRSVYHSKTCTKDNGNGSFSTYDCGSSSSESYSCTKSEQVEDYHYEPIYDTWYFYKVWRWITTDNYPTSGTGKEPFYSTDGHAVDATHRRNEQPGTYTVTFACADLGPFTRTYSLNEWNAMQVGDAYTITTNAVKAIVDLKPKEKQ
jgi:hypothetical protein